MSLRIPSGLDTIEPAYQQVCRFSNDIIRLEGKTYYSQDLYRNNIPQTIIVNPAFQWQFSTDSITWFDIQGAKDAHYLPQPMAVTTWFRRMISDCGSTEGNSTIAKIEVLPLQAPIVDPGPSRAVCPGGSVIMGGSPTAMGNAPPFTYLWSPSSGLNNAQIANPIVTPLGQPVVYTLVVTDTNGCRQLAQVKAERIIADAGPDIITCGDQPIQLSTASYSGATGISYLWTLADGTIPSAISSPYASSVIIPPPDQAVTYVIHVSDSGSIGGTCPTDTVHITLVSPPVADAGPDLLICESEVELLGLPGEPDVYYFWTPGNHLSGSFIDQPYYDGSFPYDHPLIPREYILTAIKEDAVCIAAHDTVRVYVGFARAGVDGCGPRYLGSPDPTSGAADFLWRVVSGDTLSLIGKDTMPMPFVNPSEPTLYELSVALNGVECSDQVFVPYCGCPIPYGVFPIPVDCDSYMPDLPYHIATQNVDTANYHYQWTGGDLSVLDDPYKAQPTLLTAVSSNQTYTVIVRHKLDTTITCSGVVSLVVLFGGSPPMAIVAEKSVICPDNPIPVAIGAAEVPGLVYKWTPSTGLSNDLISNPLALPDTSTIYRLEVMDPTTGCMDDTLIEVVVRLPIAYAGMDGSFCGIGTFNLGIPPEDDFVYQWQPGNIVTDSAA
ncbi:MAG: hypothetical protein IH599_09675, partial [Bacteroidales bacterium]|nr:hypothetical protein [Bacteroidales bacterium]